MQINDARNSIVIPIKCIFSKECWLEFWSILLLIKARNLFISVDNSSGGKYNIDIILLFELSRIIFLLQQLYVFRTYCEMPALKWSCDVLSKIYPWHKYAIRDKAIHLLPFHVNQESKLCKNRFSREILVINIIHYQVVLKYHYLYIHHFTNNKPCLKFFYLPCNSPESHNSPEKWRGWQSMWIIFSCQDNHPIKYFLKCEQVWIRFDLHTYICVQFAIIDINYKKYSSIKKQKTIFISSVT